MKRTTWCVVLFVCSSTLLPILGFFAVPIILIIGIVGGVISIDELYKIFKNTTK